MNRSRFLIAALLMLGLCLILGDMLVSAFDEPPAQAREVADVR